LRRGRLEARTRANGGGGGRRGRSSCAPPRAGAALLTALEAGSGLAAQAGRA
jgi:hypothetical protein